MHNNTQSKENKRTFSDKIDDIINNIVEEGNKVSIPVLVVSGVVAVCGGIACYAPFLIVPMIKIGGGVFASAGLFKIGVWLVDRNDPNPVTVPIEVTGNQNQPAHYDSTTTSRNTNNMSQTYCSIDTLEHIIAHASPEEQETIRNDIRDHLNNNLLAQCSPEQQDLILEAHYTRKARARNRAAIDSEHNNRGTAAQHLFDAMEQNREENTNTHR